VPVLFRYSQIGGRVIVCGVYSKKKAKQDVNYLFERVME
jgi:hypothetical protein